MLDNAYLIKEGNRLCPEKFIFQQYNATIHTAKSAIEIDIFSWPVKSSDLNPVENVWGWLSNEIYKKGINLTL